MTTASEPALGMCPGWCDKPAGHGWEDAWEQGITREHVHLVGRLDDSNAVLVREREIASSSGLTREREVHLDTESGVGWNPAAAARLAELVTRAARIAQAICTCTTASGGVIACRHFDCPVHGDEHHRVR